MNKNNFTHLHVHTDYSLLDGGNRISNYVKRIKELGMTSCGISDHNHLGAVIEFQAECNKNGVKPILGVELYQTWDTNILSLDADSRREYAIKKATEAGIVIPDKINKKKVTKKQINEIIKDYAYDAKQYHVLLIATNQVGYNNLVKIQSVASEKCTYNGRFCCDFDILKEYSEGVVCTSACLGGLIPGALMKNNISLARELCIKYKDIFKDRFFLEIQPLYNKEQVEVNLELIKLSKELDIKLVATNDVHYTLKEDFEDHDTLLCVGTGKKKADTERMRYEHEFWVRSYDEMIEAFLRHEDLSISIIEEALENTNLISNLVEEDIKLGSSVPLFPKVTLPKHLTAEQYLTLRTFKNLYAYQTEHPEIDIKIYEKRLKEELGIINPKGFAPYFLKIFENVDYCIQEDIPLGPGRGSASGSLVLFLNGGTKVTDPIKYDLLFFRFLTKDRKDLPDVDADFGYYGRPKLIRHLEDLHGHDAVCHIGTYTEFGVKSGLKDFARVLDIPFEEANTLSKSIDVVTEEVPGIKFKDLEALENEARELEEIKAPSAESVRKRADKYAELKELYPELFRLAIKFEGCKRNMGIHASGVLVTDCPVTDIVPTRKDPKTGVSVTIFTGPQVEMCNLVNF